MPDIIVGKENSKDIVPIGASAMLSSKLVKGAALKVYRGYDRGMCSTHMDEIKADLLAFIKA